MNRNNAMYKLFKGMKEGYAEGNMEAVEQCARCWLQYNPENPFNADTPEYEAFFQMKKSYEIWTRGDIDRKLNFRKMRKFAIELASLNPHQPYKFDKAAEEEEIRLAKEAEEKRVKNALQKQPENNTEKEEKKVQQTDAKYILNEMSKAYSVSNENAVQQYAVQLMKNTDENIFKQNTEEFDVFEKMCNAYKKHNMNELYIFAKRLCEIINYTEISPEEIKEEKKSWLKFLFPWR